jgi:5-methylcytosine-specific restriction endonuclease McrA
MPIRPENKARYPKDWPTISKRIREREGQKCKWCLASNGEPHPITGSRVVLTVAHLDHCPENCTDDNLAALCQKCHNTYDMPMRRRGIRDRAHRARAIGDLLETGNAPTDRQD